MRPEELEKFDEFREFDQIKETKAEEIDNLSYNMNLDYHLEIIDKLYKKHKDNFFVFRDIIDIDIQNLLIFPEQTTSSFLHEVMTRFYVLEELIYEKDHCLILLEQKIKQLEAEREREKAEHDENISKINHFSGKSYLNLF